MKKKRLAMTVFMMVVVFAMSLALPALSADQRIQYTEEMVGASHPTKSDTLNRLTLVEHGTDGKHTAFNGLSINQSTYTPTVSATSNVAASTPRLTAWSRVGNMVTVSGNIDIDPTNAALTSFEIDLPVASNLANVFDLGGAGVTATNNSPVAVFGSVANDTAVFSFTAGGTANETIPFTFGYIVK